MIGKASLSLDKASEQIEGMVQQGTAFARMEEVIDAASLSDPHKAALWLLAWSLREPSLQHREARLMAGAFATHGENEPAEQQPRQGVSHRQLRSTASPRRDRNQRRRR